MTFIGIILTLFGMIHGDILIALIGLLLIFIDSES